MLSYVFWHAPRADVQVTAYEKAQRAFHAALAAAPPEGLQGWMVFRTGSLPWLRADTPVYEDWYLLDSSAALDVLNDAAVRGETGKAHDHIAPLSAAGTAGLYRLRLGSWTSDPPSVAHWFSKPQGMSYGALFTALEEPCDRDGAFLWCRQMVLGPAPEFCLRGGVGLASVYPGLTTRLGLLLDQRPRRPA